MAYGETYEEFVKKFELKKTTDDCYTPPEVYDEIKNWAVKEYGLEGREIVRPFWPGADYKKTAYPSGCVVIDNPPFSILSEITEYYTSREIDFFLFAPTLVCINGFNKINYVITDCVITYENGAKVATSFKTNLGKDKIRTAPELTERIKEIQRNKNPLPKYDYNDNTITSSMIRSIDRGGVDFRIPNTERLIKISSLEAQRPLKKTIYGGGFLVSDKIAEKIKRAKEEARVNRLTQEKKEENRIVFPLSEKERQIVEELNKQH